MSFLTGGNKTTSVSPQMLPGFDSLLGPLQMGAFNAYNMPYQAEGEPKRVAPFAQDQLDAFQMARGLAGRGDPMLGYTQDVMRRLPLAALDEFSTEAAEQRMSPYLDTVLDSRMSRLREEQDIDRNKLRARQVASGAFGGSRSAVGQQLQERMQSEQRDDVTNQATQQAFEAARSQYNQDRARQMQAEQMWRQGLLSSTGLGYQGAANQRANIGLMLQLGSLQQQQQQREADSYYQYPWQQVQNLASIVYGAPRGQTQTQPGASGLSQILGTAATLGGLYKDLGGGSIFGAGGWFKDGGHVKKKRAPKLKYQDGGFIDDEDYVVGGAFDDGSDMSTMEMATAPGGMPSGGAFDDELMAILQQAGSPLERKRQFNPLLQFGLALLANESPNALAAIGQAGQTVLAGRENERLKDAKLADLNRRRQLDAAKIASQRKSAQERTQTQQQIAAERARLQERGLMSREEQAALDREQRAALAEADRRAAAERARFSRTAQTFTDASGNLMVIEPGSNRAVPVTDAEGKPITALAGDQRTRDIRALINRGFSKTEAEDIAAGRVRVVGPDEFGDVYLVNTATGERKLSTTAGQRPTGDAVGVQTGTKPPEQTGGVPSRTEGGRMSMQEAVLEGTGTGSYLANAIDALVGGAASVFGKNVEVAPVTTEAKATIRSFNQLAKGALVNNPRFPVAEQDLVGRMLPNPDALISNPNAEMQKLGVLRSTLLDARRANQDAIDSGRITQKERGDLANKNAEIDRTLALMGNVAAPTATVPAGVDQDIESLLKKYGQ